jgi:acyl dehydratase
MFTSDDGDNAPVRRVEKTFTITQAMVDAFASLTGDRNALHVDEALSSRWRMPSRAPR